MEDQTAGFLLCQQELHTFYYRPWQVENSHLQCQIDFEWPHQNCMATFVSYKVVPHAWANYFYNCLWIWLYPVAWLHISYLGLLPSPIGVRTNFSHWLQEGVRATSLAPVRCFHFKWKNLLQKYHIINTHTKKPREFQMHMSMVTTLPMNFNMHNKLHKV